MFKILGTFCAVAIVALAFSTSAQARGGSRGGHFGGARIGHHYGGARIGGLHYGGAYHGRYYRGGYRRYGSYGYRHGARIGRYYGRGYRGRYYRGGYRRYGPYGYRYGGYWPYWGWGLAAGALAWGWPYYYDDGYAYYEGPTYDSAVAYCIRRFKSYDPISRTYLGYDGYRHPCP